MIAYFLIAGVVIWPSRWVISKRTVEPRTLSRASISIYLLVVAVLTIFGLRSDGFSALWYTFQMGMVAAFWYWMDAAGFNRKPADVPAALE
jgi:hypothetical protein